MERPAGEQFRFAATYCRGLIVSKCVYFTHLTHLTLHGSECTGGPRNNQIIRYLRNKYKSSTQPPDNYSI